MLSPDVLNNLHSTMPTFIHRMVSQISDSAPYYQNRADSSLMSKNYMNNVLNYVQRRDQYFFSLCTVIFSIFFPISQKVMDKTTFLILMIALLHFTTVNAKPRPNVSNFSIDFEIAVERSFVNHVSWFRMVKPPAHFQFCHHKVVLRKLSYEIS